MTRTLHPETAAFLEQLATSPAPPLEQQTAAQARELYAAGATVVAGPAADVAAVEHAAVAGVPCDVVRPHGWVDGGPAVLYLHGGGWVVGSPSSYRHVTTALAAGTGALVVVPDYRLAPEHPHPVAQDDCRAVWDGLAALGADPGRVALAGDSAGGHLAAWLAQRVRDAVLAQALVYPAVHPRLDTPSALGDDGRHGLSTPAMRWYWEQYLAGADPADPRVDLLAGQLGGLPPAFVAVAGWDPLRDEGVAYAEALRTAGVEVELAEWPGHVHGFLRTSAVTPVGAGELVDALVAFLRRHLT